MRKNRQFHFWTMFTIPRLEQWLESQAAMGLVLENVRYHYFFSFRQGSGQQIAFNVDFRRYIPDGYIAELDRNNWLRKKLSYNWQLIYRGYKKEYPLLSTSYDLDMAAGLKRNSIITLVVLAAIIISFLAFTDGWSNIFARVAMVLGSLMTIYNILRMSFYRIMLTERARRR